MCVGNSIHSEDNDIGYLHDVGDINNIINIK